MIKSPYFKPQQTKNIQPILHLTFQIQSDVNNNVNILISHLNCGVDVMGLELVSSNERLKSETQRRL